MKSLFIVLSISLFACTTNAKVLDETTQNVAIILPSKDATTRLTFENFEQEFFDYEPSHYDGVSDNQFEFGKMVIRETKAALKNKVENYHVAHYWNIATAFSALKEKNEYIKIAFIKATKSDGVCDYFDSFDGVENHFSSHFPEFYEQEKAKCNGIEKKAEVNPKEYAAKNGFDESLILQIAEISKKDQLYRHDHKKDKQKQIALDKQNQKAIDKLYKQHGTYLGQKIVGKEYEDVMWAVIQHSNVEMMERYLPVLHQAYLHNELAEAQLKMTLDRIYTKKQGSQPFGSQIGVPLASEELRLNLIKKYNLN